MAAMFFRCQSYIWSTTVLHNIDIVLDVPDTSGESKINTGPPSGGPKTTIYPDELYILQLLGEKAAFAAFTPSSGGGRNPYIK